MAFVENKNGYDYINFLSLDENGITNLSLLDVQSKIIENFKLIYGFDIDLSENTPDKIWLDKMSELFYLPIHIVKLFYDELDIDKSSGVFLDTLCDISSIYRKLATQSKAKIKLKYIGSINNTYIGKTISNNSFKTQQLVLIDDNQREWIWKEGGLPDGTFKTSVSPNDEKELEFTCEDYGEIVEIPNPRFIDTSLRLKIMNDESYPIKIVAGRNDESDDELRNRQKKETGHLSLTTKDGLKYSLQNLSFVEKCQIFTKSDIVNKSNLSEEEITVFPVNSIYIKMYYAYDINNNEKKKIAETIFCNLPICTETHSPSSEPNKNELTLTSPNPKIEKNIIWNTCTYEHVSFVIKVYSCVKIMPESDRNLVVSTINKFLKNLEIGEDLISSKIISKLNSVFGTYEGKKKYLFYKCYIPDSESTDEIIYYKNKGLTYFQTNLNYTSSEASSKTFGDYYDLTLTEIS